MEEEKEIEEEEKTAFNLAIATLERIRNLLDKAAEYSQNSLTISEWFYALRAVVSTIYSKTNEEERKEIDKTEIKIEILLKDRHKKGLIWHEIRAYSNRIHEILDKYGMLIPKMKDIRHLFGRRI